MSAHIQQTPRYHCLRRSQPRPEAETVSAYPRVRVHSRPRSPRSPTAEDYEDAPEPTTATSPGDPTTHTHAQAHTSAQGHGPTHGQWWQRWTHTQLWEVRKRAWAEPSLKGLVRRPRRGSAENCRLQPEWGWMSQATWEAMLANALHPKGVHLRELSPTQDHPYVLRHLRETIQETWREGRRLWDITPSPPPHTDTPSPPRKRRCTDTGSTGTTSTRSTPGTPRTTEHDAPEPRPAAPPPNPTGDYFLGRAKAARRRRSLPPQPNSPGSVPRTNPPR